jgi:hypothetical protein
MQFEYTVWNDKRTVSYDISYLDCIKNNNGEQNLSARCCCGRLEFLVFSAPLLPRHMLYLEHPGRILPRSSGRGIYDDVTQTQRSDFPRSLQQRGRRSSIRPRGMGRHPISIVSGPDVPRRTFLTTTTARKPRIHMPYTPES